MAALVVVLEGAVAGGTISALAGALASIGISENSVLDYETEIKAGKFLLLAHGTAAEVARAREILGVGALATA
ncbi:general stress protein [Hymenobacter sp. BRD128]|uniref:general stress protein n=1 Tax=Hymenobacter sp. BRD128 TaxID=2675878 RepID=UPI0020B8C87A|nr:general stress protein [Hymenobacter sp. BRD128]